MLFYSTSIWETQGQQVLGLFKARVVQAELFHLQVLSQARGPPSRLFVSFLPSEWVALGRFADSQQQQPEKLHFTTKTCFQVNLQCGARAREAGGCCFQCLGRWFLPHNIPMAREQQHQHRWSWTGGSKTTAPTPMDPRLTPSGWSVPATPAILPPELFSKLLPSQELFLVSFSLVSPYSIVTWGGHQVGAGGHSPILSLLLPRSQWDYSSFETSWLSMLIFACCYFILLVNCYFLQVYLPIFVSPHWWKEIGENYKGK